MAFKQALYYHRVQFFYYGPYCPHPYPGYDQNFPMMMSMMTDDSFWRRYWTDDARTLERVLNSDRVEKCNKGAGHFVHLSNAYNLRGLIKITASRFDMAERMPQKPVAAYPRFYLWHFKGKRIVHSHSGLLRVLHRLSGWEAELPIVEKGMRFYTYQDPENRVVTSFGFAWPDLLKTPALYLLRFARFVTEPEGPKKLPQAPQVHAFTLREYVPHDMFEYVIANALLKLG